MTNFLVGDRSRCKLVRSIATPMVSPIPSLSSYPLYFSPAHLPDQFASPNSSQNNAITQHPKHAIVCASPVASSTLHWKQSMP
jgi:hypothetical protein